MSNLFELGNILSELETQINAYCLEQLQAIRNDAENILRDAIQTKVYDYYPNPIWYERTNSLLNSVNVEIKSMNGINTLYVFVDTNLLNYMSAYNKRNSSRGTVSNAVPYWIDEGHYDSNNYFGGGNQFDEYEGRHYLEEAFEQLQSRYGKEGFVIEIDRDNFAKGSW